MGVMKAEGKEEKVATVLQACLKGDAAEVVRTTSSKDCKNVAKSKAELLARFDQKDKTLILKKVLRTQVGDQRNSQPKGFLRLLMKHETSW